MLPYDAEVEAVVLGSLLGNSTLFEDVKALRDAEEPFYIEQHRFLFDALLALYDEGVATDNLVLVQKLRKNGVLDRVGGVGGLAELHEVATSAGTFVEHVRYLTDLARRRERIRSAQRIVQAAMDLSISPKSVVEAEALRMLEMDQDRTEKVLQDVLVDVVDEFNRIADGEEISGLKTGIEHLDEMTNGFLGGDFIILAARPSVGKTALVFQWMIKMAAGGHPVGFISLETSAKKLVRRGLCMLAEVPMAQVRLGKVLGDVEWLDKVHRAATRVDTYPIYINDSASMTIGDIYAVARRWKQQYHIKVLAIDYLQIITLQGENRNIEIGKATKSLKELSKALEIPVIVLSQLSRDVEKRGGWHKPRLSDLRDSGSIEQDAELVMFIWRPSQYDDIDAKNRNEIEDHYGVEYLKLASLLVAKNKDGPTGEVTLQFNKDYGYFSEV